MKWFLSISILLLFPLLSLGDGDGQSKQIKQQGVTAYASASACIVTPEFIGLDSITKKIVYSDSTCFKSDTIKGRFQIYLLHFN